MLAQRNIDYSSAHRNTTYRQKSKKAILSTRYFLSYGNSLEDGKVELVAKHFDFFDLRILECISKKSQIVTTVNVFNFPQN